MKKSKLSLSLMTALLSVSALAGCDKNIISSNRGVLISYNGKEISSAEILEEYFDDSSKYQSIYDSIYSIIVKNYFNIEGLEVETKQYKLNSETSNYKIEKQVKKLGSADMAKIQSRAQEKIDIDKDTAKENADANSTSVKKELEAICESHGVKYDKELFELKEKYIDEIKKEMFDDDFYTYYEADLLKGAGTVADGKEMSEGVKGIFEGYLDSQVPYHVSHILVKLDDSANKYADGTISEANAKKLYDVVNQIAFGDDSFSTIAKYFSEDEGSAKLGGDLGIMDTSTGYVNEFKLGVYAYENLYKKTLLGGSHENVPAGTYVSMLDEQKANYTRAVNENESEDVVLPTVDFSVFEELNEFSEVTKANEKSVIEDASLVYPRNIVYNKELNKHSISFITGNSEMVIGDGKSSKYVQDPNGTKTINGKKYRIEANTAGTGFVKYEGLDKPVLSVLVAGEWQPILCVRAGSDYQGIHFIVINRSAFTAVDAKGVSTEDYYTTAYPELKAEYPKAKVAGTDEYLDDLKTYVNFSSDDTSKTKSRAEEFASKLKSFDSDRLSKYIFMKFKEIEGVRILNEKLDKALNKWIETSLEKHSDEREESWKKTWTEYIDSLQKQASERTKLVSDTCKLVFKGANQELSLQGAINTLYSEKTAAEKDAITAQIVKDVKAHYASGLVKLYDVNGQVIKGTSDADILTASVDSLFKKEGGLCNDGKEHN